MRVLLLMAATLVAAITCATARAGGEPTPPFSPPLDGPCYFPQIDCGAGSLETGTFTESPSLYSNSPDASAGRCRTRWAAATRRNYYYVVVFRYYEQARWCWNGLRVTYMHRDRWPANTNYGWAFDGHIGGNCSNEWCVGMTGAASENVWTQGRFHVCLGALGINICNYKYPIVSITVRADGSSAASASGA